MLSKGNIPRPSHANFFFFIPRPSHANISHVSCEDVCKIVINDKLCNKYTMCIGHTTHTVSMCIGHTTHTVSLKGLSSSRMFHAYIFCSKIKEYFLYVSLSSTDMYHNAVGKESAQNLLSKMAT